MREPDQIKQLNILGTHAVALSKARKNRGKEK